MEKLTQRQQQVLDLIKQYIDDTGYPPTRANIAEHLGYSRATVNKAIKVLEENELIRIEKRSRYHCVYHLLKVRCKDDETQMSSRGNSDVNQS